MADPIAEIAVGSEDEAWALLERALGEGMPEHQVPALDFQDWPIVTVHLPDTPIAGSISPSMMEAFIELQKTVYRAHTFISSDTGDLRTLSRLEKDRFEFRVKVDEGSSHYGINLSKIFERLGTEAIGKMTSAEIMIVVIGTALIVGGVTAYKAWLNSRIEMRKIESADQEKKNWLEQQKSQMENETRRMEIFAEAMDRQPLLQEIDAATDSDRQQMVKAISDERGGSVAGLTITPELGSEIVAQRRRQGQDVRLAGEYRVDRVDTTVEDGFRVTLSEVVNGTTVTASMQDAIVSEEHKRLIRNAEWQKAAVYVELAARRLRNRIVDAVVVNVREVEAEGRT